MDPMEKQADISGKSVRIPETGFPSSKKKTGVSIYQKLGALIVFLLVFIPLLRPTWTTKFIKRNKKSPSFDHLASHCADVAPITASEFYKRQHSLAETLHSLGASAYVAEPGANAHFFTNVSSSRWHLSERPFLLVIAPEVVSDKKVKPRISVITPKFEATRAHLLSIPAKENVSFFEWDEDSSPYLTAISALGTNGEKIYVDGDIRKFIADGLADVLPENEVLTAPLEVKSLRERKSDSEIEILRCANEVTLLAIRSVRKEMYIGMRESEAQSLVIEALASAGLADPFVLGLFGENAALPHGSGTDRALGKEDLILFDCGGTLHEYHSDITRTFALKDSRIPTKHLEVWFTVHAAQTAALASARNGTLTRAVDKAARTVITEAGYGSYFTHRLGHGLGLEEHEGPYLRGGSADTILTGHVFTDEPGVYIEGEVGVRLEDSFYVSAEHNGESVLLTERVGGQAVSPWLI